MNIVTVTLNPALDKTAVLDDLRPGELNRLRGVEVDAGGKGVNVSKMIACLGGRSLATGFIGGGSGDEIARSLAARGVPHDFVRVAGTTRTNLKVVDRGGRLTELNEPGAEISPRELADLEAKLASMAGPESLFVFSGSVPRGVGPDVYARLVGMVRSAGARAFVDADGEPFRAALAARPDFIKPNSHELLEYFGLSGPRPRDELADLCRRLLADGVGRVILSMGGAGALFVDAAEVLFSPALDVPVKSTVGAGDSMVAAVAHAESVGLGWREAAALAMAASAGAVTTSGTRPPGRGLVEELAKRVRLETV